MNKMQLANKCLPQNVGRPNSRADFDLMIGSNVYERGKQTSTGWIWETSLINNLMGLFFSMILWPAAIFVATADISISELELWEKIALGFLGFIGALITLMLTALIFYRRRLIIDHDAGELRFCRWTNRPYHVLPLRDIRSMSFENIHYLSSSDIDLEGGTTTNMATMQVLIAELHDGRIASIAFRPQAEMFKAITGWTDADICNERKKGR